MTFVCTSDASVLSESGRFVVQIEESRFAEMIPNLKPETPGPGLGKDVERKKTRGIADRTSNRSITRSPGRQAKDLSKMLKEGAWTEP